ncbi:MAG TPA: prepilin-type N-terminal cleavage/methylation domain-containing protein [Candidatus Paceibacterota bacterium]|jgi:prepilin-type N-terminal cleavage/methylation domain-containing protein|nr:prepilin-type N-terminal cleavage/methylation domain-containing protein [Candidatus Paceibacterota bacterium]
MKKLNFKRGFTLIELLVVVAIIGILASVVLASLNTARNKGANAAVKANLAGARAGAELFYDTASTYTGVCASGGTGTIYNAVLAAAKATGLSAVTVVGTGTAATATCNTNGTAWAAEAPLKVSESGNVMWCVDSTGKSTGEAATIGAANACL